MKTYGGHWHRQYMEVSRLLYTHTKWTQYLVHGRLGGPQSRSERCGEESNPGCSSSSCTKYIWIIIVMVKNGFGDFDKCIRSQGFWVRKSVLVMPFKYLHVYMSLARSWTVPRTLFTFGIYEFVSHRSVPGECEHSSSKKRGPSNRPQTHKVYFLESGFNKCDQISIIYGDHLPKSNYMGGFVRN